MDVFFKLLKILVPANIPVFLIKDKIYCQLSFSKIVKSNLDKILKPLLNEKKGGVKFVQCASYNFKSSGFFINIFNSNKSISKRYIERLKTYK